MSSLKARLLTKNLTAQLKVIEEGKAKKGNAQSVNRGPKDTKSKKIPREVK